MKGMNCYHINQYISSLPSIVSHEGVCSIIFWDLYIILVRLNYMYVCIYVYIYICT